MPTLKHLIEELEELDIDPKKIKLPSQLSDDLLNDAEYIAEESLDNTEEED